MDDLLRMSKAYRAEVQEESAPSPVQHLRARLQHALHKEYDTRWRQQLTEPTLSRFLEDERGDVDRATRRVLAWLRWRDEYHVDQLVLSRLQLDGLPLLMVRVRVGVGVGVRVRVRVGVRRLHLARARLAPPARAEARLNTPRAERQREAAADRGLGWG